MATSSRPAIPPRSSKLWSASMPTSSWVCSWGAMRDHRQSAGPGQGTPVPRPIASWRARRDEGRRIVAFQKKSKKGRGKSWHRSSETGLLFSCGRLGNLGPRMSVLDSFGSRLSFLQKGLCRVTAFGVLSVLLRGDVWEQGHPQQPIEIFAGVTYGCERLAITDEGGGLVHWVRVDLTAPGVELYVTPLDPAAVARGWQYRLREIEDVVARERLAVAVNATYFATEPGPWLRFSGDLALSMQTLISDHVIAYGPWGASLLWFDAELAPHVLRPRSAVEPVVGRAKWAVGAHELELQNGQVVWGGDSTADARTAIGIDEARRLLFLVVGERISQARMLHILADLGAKDGFLLDGGGSRAMAIGQGR